MKRIKISLTLNSLRIAFTSICFALLTWTWAQAAERQQNTATHAPLIAKPTPDAVIRLWPGDAPNLIAGGKSESIVNDRYVNVSVPQLFVYLPSKEKANGTALIICAGGGYSHLTRIIHQPLRTFRYIHT